MTTAEARTSHPTSPEQIAEQDTRAVTDLLDALGRPLDFNFKARDAVVVQSFKTLGFEDKARYLQVIEGPRSNKPELFKDAVDAWLENRTPVNSIGAYEAAAMLGEIAEHADGTGVAKRRSGVIGIMVARVDNRLAVARESGATGPQLDFYETLRSTLKFDQTLEQAKTTGKLLGAAGIGFLIARRLKRRD